MVVRTLRHEVGDLLQSVYSAVAILQERLPRGQNLERTILSDLRGRAEMCKNELDATHDLVCPVNLNQDWVELSELASGIAGSFALRYPGLQIVCEAPRPVKVWGDGPKLAQAGTLLMMVAVSGGGEQDSDKRVRPAVQWGRRMEFRFTMVRAPMKNNSAG